MSETKRTYNKRPIMKEVFEEIQPKENETENETALRRFNAYYRKYNKTRYHEKKDYVWVYLTPEELKMRPKIGKGSKIIRKKVYNINKEIDEKKVNEKNEI